VEWFFLLGKYLIRRDVGRVLAAQLHLPCMKDVIPGSKDNQHIDCKIALLCQRVVFEGVGGVDILREIGARCPTVQPVHFWNVGGLLYSLARYSLALVAS